MGEFLEQLPPEIQVHIKQITSASGLPDDEESYEKMAQGWLEKKRIFEEETAKQDMVEVESLAVDHEQGGVALTFSGSLVLIGPLIDGLRKAAYNSIGVRKNVPDAMVQENSALANEVAVNKPIEFETGPVKSTSAIYKIAVCKEEVATEVQEEKISEVTVIMTEEFVEVNKALVPT